MRKASQKLRGDESVFPQVCELPPPWHSAGFSIHRVTKARGKKPLPTGSHSRHGFDFELPLRIEQLAADNG